MCGIAGYSLTSKSSTQRTFCAQALLAAIAERGADAVGYAYRRSGRPTVVKQRTPASSELLDRVSVPAGRDAAADARARLHEGPPVDRRQQPPRPPRRRRRDPQRDHHERRRAARRARLRAAEPRMTVDSEAIFALAAHSRNDPRGARDTSAARWRPPGSTSASRASSSSRAGAAARSGSARARRGLLRLDRASARDRRALLPARAAQARGQGRHVVRAGRTARSSRRERFRPDLDYVEPDPLPAVRAPGERDFCLTRLAAIAAPARRLPERAVGVRPSTPSSSSRSRTRYWNVPHAPRRARTAGRPATRSAARVAAARPPASRRTSAAGRARARAPRPASIARSSRSSPTATSKPASRSAVDSEPNVCQ